MISRTPAHVGIECRVREARAVAVGEDEGQGPGGIPRTGPGHDHRGLDLCHGALLFDGDEALAGDGG